MKQYLTCGQVARMLRISISTLKRWISESDFPIADRRNYNGWRLFANSDVDVLRNYKRAIKKNGRRFNDTTLLPIVENQADEKNVAVR